VSWAHSENTLKKKKKKKKIVIIFFRSFFSTRPKVRSTGSFFQWRHTCLFFLHFSLWLNRHTHTKREDPLSLLILIVNANQVLHVEKIVATSTGFIISFVFLCVCVWGPFCVWTRTSFLDWKMKWRKWREFDTWS
jgi:hypothetical protein